MRRRSGDKTISVTIAARSPSSFMAFARRTLYPLSRLLLTVSWGVKPASNHVIPPVEVRHQNYSFQLLPRDDFWRKCCIRLAVRASQSNSTRNAERDRLTPTTGCREPRNSHPRERYHDGRPCLRHASRSGACEGRPGRSGGALESPITSAV